MIPTNPASSVKGVRREEKESAILNMEQYKALLYEVTESHRDYTQSSRDPETGRMFSQEGDKRWISMCCSRNGSYSR